MPVSQQARDKRVAPIPSKTNVHTAEVLVGRVDDVPGVTTVIVTTVQVQVIVVRGVAQPSLSTAVALIASWWNVITFSRWYA